ncbi:hypothetical protein [Hydrogenophaga sp. IBVHS2]|uniref:hypothetical protein n=1 Tax=Hydrogenophaga sp. IBVHS2 TaxID=1985170 RepID=UPI0026A7A92B
MTSHLVVRRPYDGCVVQGQTRGVLHRSDQGSRYNSEHFQNLLAEQGITCSMSRAGEVCDNSAMERFFSPL